jgi:hypothetical protein
MFYLILAELFTHTQFFLTHITYETIPRLILPWFYFCLWVAAQYTREFSMFKACLKDLVAEFDINSASETIR